MVVAELIIVDETEVDKEGSTEGESVDCKVSDNSGVGVKDGNNVVELLKDIDAVDEALDNEVNDDVSHIDDVVIPEKVSYEVRLEKLVEVTDGEAIIEDVLVSEDKTVSEERSVAVDDDKTLAEFKLLNEIALVNEARIVPLDVSVGDDNDVEENTALEVAAPVKEASIVLLDIPDGVETMLGTSRGADDTVP